MTATVDVQRIRTDLAKLASFSESPAPAVTRIVFGEMDLRARAYLKTLFAQASLVVHEDAVGNTFARWLGREPTLPPVATGSHCDAIPGAGRFDGTVGVIGGLEAIRALQQSGFTPRRSIDLILFTSEEPTRFGIRCLGSRLLAAALDASAGDTLTSDGRTLNEMRRSAGFSGSLTDVPLPPGAYAAFVELHIEQGPILDREQLDIGVVTSIAAPASLRILNADPPARCAQTVVDAIVAACDARALRYQRMISRAYHDSLFMSRIAPTGMIFIPCRGGISHRPDEYASPEAIAHGTEVLADTLASLSA